MKHHIERKLFIGMAACLVLTLFLVMPALAFSPGDGSGPHRGMCGKGGCYQAFGIWRNPEMIRELNITDQQVGQLKASEFKFRDKQVELNGRIDKLHLEMEKAFSEDPVDNDAVIQLAEKIADAKGRMFVHQIESRLAMGKILTPDQMKKLNTFKMPLRRNMQSGSCPRMPMGAGNPDNPGRMKEAK
jgi:Spy/CpxP family protein refolding chaperone